MPDPPGEGVEAAAEAAETAAGVPPTIAEMVIPNAPNVASVARYTKLKIVLS